MANRLFFPWVPKLDPQPGLFFSDFPNVHLNAMACQHTLTWVCPFLLPSPASQSNRQLGPSLARHLAGCVCPSVLAHETSRERMPLCFFLLAHYGWESSSFMETCRDYSLRWLVSGTGLTIERPGWGSRKLQAVMSTG